MRARNIPYTVATGRTLQAATGPLKDHHFTLPLRAGDAEALLLSAGQRIPALIQLVFALIPNRRLAEGTLNKFIHVSRVAVDASTEGDVLVDALREWVGLLEHHPNSAAHFHGINPGPIKVNAPKQNAPLQ